MRERLFGGAADVLRVARTEPAVLGRVDAIRGRGIRACGEPLSQRVEVVVAAGPQQPAAVEAARPPRGQVALGLDLCLLADARTRRAAAAAQRAAREAKQFSGPHQRVIACDRQGTAECHESWPVSLRYSW